PTDPETVFARAFRARLKERRMHAPIKYFEKGLAVAANGAWVVFNGLNQIAQHPSFTPAWSDKPLLKSYQKTKPPLGWPREHDTRHTDGSSTIKHGLGSVLTVDLTNRCNMMCDPCFMDANQVGFVHELTWDDIKMVLDNAISIKPKRQMSVQFSGGEPTISPY